MNINLILLYGLVFLYFILFGSWYGPYLRQCSFRCNELKSLDIILFISKRKLIYDKALLTHFTIIILTDGTLIRVNRHTKSFLYKK